MRLLAMSNKVKSSKRKRSRRSTFPTLYLAILTVLTYVPIAVVVVYSFNESKISSVWDGFSLRWYKELFQDPAMFRALFISILLGVSSCLIAAVIATLAAIGLPRAKLPGRKLVEYLSSLPIIIPEIVLGMVFLVYFSLLNLPFGMTTLIIAHTSFCIPYIYMQVKARLIGLDESYYEAARDLGASSIRAFFDITLPLIMPAVISGMFLSFAMSFDDVIISVFVTGVSTDTLPIKVYTQLKTSTTPKINALCTLMLVVTVFCYVMSYVFSRIGRRNMKTQKEREHKEAIRKA